MHKGEIIIEQITNDIYYVGVNDNITDLFEGQFIIPNGISYNSYLILDDYITLISTVDIRFFDEWIGNIKEVLKDKKIDFIFMQHVEVDHSESLIKFLEYYPDAFVVANSEAFKLIEQFYNKNIKRKYLVSNNDVIDTGTHKFKFIFAPMVHWPEVMFIYDSVDKVLFTADAFGKFGSRGTLEEWDCEARRYYFNIVGKYGNNTKDALEKINDYKINIIAPLHGEILDNNIKYYINLYKIWSNYDNETDGVAIFYTSVYGNTSNAVKLLEAKLKEYNATNVVVTDLARCDIAEAVEDAFRYNNIVLATTTYNGSIFPFMRDFLNRLVERNFQNKKIALIENGSWNPNAINTIKAILLKSRYIEYASPTITIKSSLSNINIKEIDDLAKNLCKKYLEKKNHDLTKLDNKALFNIEYGLYLLTTNDGFKDNGIIINTVMQITSNPLRIIVSVSKDSYSYNTIKVTKKFNLNMLDKSAPFSLFKLFGFKSGRNTDKFKDMKFDRLDNKLVILKEHITSYLSCIVIDYVDFVTHGLFVCEIVESKVLSNNENMTYNYYQKNVKENNTVAKNGYVCSICGYFHEGEIDKDFICPICKHGIEAFEKV